MKNASIFHGKGSTPNFHWFPFLKNGLEKKGYPETKNLVQPFYDWEKIKNNCREFIFVNSDNDPWGCNDIEGKNLFDHLGGTLIIKHGEGHMRSNSFKQPYKEFPLLLSLIDDNLWSK